MKQSQGFTLIELITVLVLVGIVGVFGGLFMIKMVQSYRWAEDNAHLSQKAQVALTRITVEMAEAQEVNPDPDSNRVGLTDRGVARSLIYNNGRLILLEGSDEYVLTDRVRSFSIIYDDEDNFFLVKLIMAGVNDAEVSFERYFAMP